MSEFEINPKVVLWTTVENCVNNWDSVNRYITDYECKASSTQQHLAQATFSTSSWPLYSSDLVFLGGVQLFLTFIILLWIIYKKS